MLAALEVFAQDLAGGPDVLAQIGDDVALHGLDGLGDAGEVGGELAGEVEDVLRLFEELFLVCGFDGATTLESRDLGVEVVSFLAELGEAGVGVVVGVEAEPVDGLEQGADAGLGDAGASAAGAACNLERADGLGGEPVDLNVVVDLRDEPADLDPVSADLAGGAGGEPSLVVVISGGAELVDGLADLGVGVGDGDGRSVGGEHDGERGDDEGGVSTVEQVEHRVPEGRD